MRVFLPLASLFAGLYCLCASDVFDRSPPWDAAIVATFNRGDATDRSWVAGSGTLVNGASIGNNTYATFDGTNDYIDFGTSSARNCYPITVSVWFNTRSNDQIAYATMLGKYTSGSFNGFFIWMDTSERVVAFYGKSASHYVGGDAELQSAASYKDNSWHHVVVRAGPTGASLWIDGASSDVDAWLGTAQTTDTATALRMGDHTSGTAFPWRGDLDDLMIFNRSLSDDEVAAIYATGRR